MKISILFVFFLFSSSHITQKLYVYTNIIHTKQLLYYWRSFFSELGWRAELQLASYGHKSPPVHKTFLFWLPCTYSVWTRALQTVVSLLSTNCVYIEVQLSYSLFTCTILGLLEDRLVQQKMLLRVSRSTVVLLQVQNGRLYIRYRSNSQKNEAEEWKKLTDYIILLFYC